MEEVLPIKCEGGLSRSGGETTYALPPLLSVEKLQFLNDFKGIKELDKVLENEMIYFGEYLAQLEEVHRMLPLFWKISEMEIDYFNDPEDGKPNFALKIKVDVSKDEKNKDVGAFFSYKNLVEMNWWFPFLEKNNFSRDILLWINLKQEE